MCFYTGKPLIGIHRWWIDRHAKAQALPQEGEKMQVMCLHVSFQMQTSKNLATRQRCQVGDPNLNMYGLFWLAFFFPKISMIIATPPSDVLVLPWSTMAQSPHPRRRRLACLLKVTVYIFEQTDKCIIT